MNAELKTYPPVLTKRDFVRRYARGEFGNRSPTWETFPEFRSSGYTGLVHIRNRVAGGITFYNLTPEQAARQWTELDGREFYVGAMCPTEKTVLQGEVLRTHLGLVLRYTQVAKPMREALAEEQHHCNGLPAAQLLRRYMCPNSWEWLNVLLNRYPGHVVEFTTFSEPYGTLPGYNTVFWETRLY